MVKKKKDDSMIKDVIDTNKEMVKDIKNTFKDLKSLFKKK